MLSRKAHLSTALVAALATQLALSACASGPDQNSSTDGWGNNKRLHALLQPTLFVANKRGNTLSKIDLDTGEEVLRKESCTNPHELATSPDGKHVALACYGGRMIEIFRTADLSLGARIQLGEGARPHGIVWKRSNTIYVTAEGRQSIFRIIDPLDTVQTAEFSTGREGSHMLVIAPDEKTAWTTDLGSKTVTKVDLLRKAKPLSVNVGEEPEGIALAPDGKTLWVSARGSNKAYAVDPLSMEVRKEIDTGAFPLRLAIRPQGDFAVTSDLADGGLTVIDLQRSEPVRQIAVSSAEEAEARLQVTILWSDDGERIYVAETGTDTVAEVDFASGRVLRRLKTGKGGDGLAIISAAGDTPRQ